MGLLKPPYENCAQAAHHQDAGQNGNPSGSELIMVKQPKGSDQFKVDTTGANNTPHG
jgi:hypothetical protein